MSTNTIDIAIANAAAKGDATIYVGEAATLSVTLTNNTGGNIGLQNGATASLITLYMPTYFTVTELQNMSISLTDWTFSVDTGNLALLLTYSGSGSWPQNGSIQFDITNVESNATPNTQPIQVNFSNMTGNVPLQIQANLTLMNPPQPGNASLADVLQLSLDNQGSIYVSEPNDILQNSIFLNIKNTGSTPLYNGQSMWTGNPKIVATFVYGNTSGALAPDNDPLNPGLGSAWNIIGSIYINQGGNWQIENPVNTGIDPHPQWTMSPTNTNQSILGTGATANITFDFSEIISITPIGHTQITLLFTGFMKDSTTPYDEQTFVLDIVKQTPPPTRGLINFFGDNPVVQVTNPDTAIDIPLRWAMFDVDQVNLITNYPGMPLFNKQYTPALPLDYDNKTVSIPGVTQDTAVFITLQSFNGAGAFLNSLQFSAFIQASFFQDPRDGKTYPVVQIGSKIWMAANLDYKSASGSAPYANNSANEATYGRLYTLDAASNNIPAGWRLPSQNDWDDLVQNYSDAGAAYTALIAGGASGFDAQLGGLTQGGSSSNMAVVGYYWTATPESGSSNYYAQFSSRSATVSTVAYLPNANMLSVRYVKDVN
jgi:uncharacterized protein (TIGR02145 family)